MNPPESPLLFAPLRLRNLELANRIVVAPMCQYSCQDGNAGDWHLMHLGHLALGGAGLLIVEATGVESTGRITPGCLGLYSDDNERHLKVVVDFVRRNSPCALAVQLNHAGRKASSRLPWDGGQALGREQGGWECVAPSAVPHSAKEPAPRALDEPGMAAIAGRFGDAAARADRLGFDAIELHFAHGYLLHQFLSPLANRRSDAYGGSLENRMRFPLDVFRSVRERWPTHKPLGVRLSATDWVPGGWDADEAVVLSRHLGEAGCDWIDVSSGGISTAQRIPASPLYQVNFAERIRNEAGVRTIAVGLITEPTQAEEILRKGQADLIALARGMLNEPRWAWRAARELGGQVHGPKQYYRNPPQGTRDIFFKTRMGFR